MVLVRKRQGECGSVFLSIVLYNIFFFSQVCFVALHVTVMLSLAAFKMGFQLKLHIRQSWTGYLTAGIQQSALSFMLFWTLFYGLVHLY
mmetsp:Transcript_2927/g.6511  ORF Transcript_2927/g.6511 Transcript_2927/m.6511 type:complete len:89 (+) Transcript_2927:383-649(+)